MYTRRSSHHVEFSPTVTFKISSCYFNLRGSSFLGFRLAVCHMFPHLTFLIHPFYKETEKPFRISKLFFVSEGTILFIICKLSISNSNFLAFNLLKLMQRQSLACTNPLNVIWINNWQLIYFFHTGIT